MTPVGRGGLESSFRKFGAVTIGKFFFFFFKYFPKIQSRRVPASGKAGDLKFLTHVAEIIVTRICKKKLFRNDVRYVGLAPERLSVTTYGTSVRRKRVNEQVLFLYIKKKNKKIMSLWDTNLFITPFSAKPIFSEKKKKDFKEIL